MLLKSNGKPELHFILVNVLAILHIQGLLNCYLNIQVHFF